MDMNPDHSATGRDWLAHQGASSWTVPKRGRSPCDIYDTSDRGECMGVKKSRLDPAEASRAFPGGSNDLQNWEEWDQAPQMFQQAQNFTIQGDLTFKDVQGHVDATYLATTRSSLSTTAAEFQYQQSYIPSPSLDYPIPGQSYNDPHALTAIGEGQAGPTSSSESSLAGAIGDARDLHNNISVNIPASHGTTRSNYNHHAFDQVVTGNSTYRPGSSSNSGVSVIANPVPGRSTHSFQGASNLDFSGTSTFINAQSYTSNTFVTPSTATSDVAVVAEALSIINFRNFLVDHLRKRVGKTGRWVISEPKFSKWRQGPRGILWGTGMPGAGKTILASIIIEYLMELAKSNQRICVAFAFSRYTDPLTVEEILAGLLRQILEDHPQTIVYIQRMHDHHSIRKTRPSKQELIGVLEAIFTSNLFDQRFCSLDGLDEAKSITQFELLEALSQLPVNLLITSRPLHLLEGNIPTADHFSIILQDADIERLIEERVRQIPTLASLLARDEFKKWVVKTVVEKSSGMFLVASLQLDSLVECVDIRELRQAVETLPVGVEAMYQATMLRVEAHRQAAKAKHALTWLVHALESLTMDGLRYAIAVDRETFEFEPELLINGGTLLSLCCGLVTYEPESDLVRLVHYTAKDFLEPYLKHEDPDPHAMIASTCATRLLQFNLNDVPVDMAAHIKNDGYRLDNFLYEDPFLPYSFHQWAKHSNFSAALPAPARDLILRSSSFPICTEDQYFICLGTSVHVAAAYNFHPLLEEWFHPSRHPADKVQSQLLPMYPQGVDINTDASDGSTALAIAAYCGHVDTVKLLLTVEGIDVEACGTCEPGRKPLVRAATAGHLDIVEMLLAVVGMDHTSAGLGSSALISASCGGHVEVVSTLLRFKIAYIEKFSQGDPSEEVSLIRECGEALVLAARNKYQDTIKTILGVKGINVNYHSPMYGRTALMFASMQGPKSTVEILLRCKDIAIDHPSPTGITALACALKSGQHNIAELLRLHGAEEPSADVFRSYIHNHSVKPWDIT